MTLPLKALNSSAESGPRSNSRQGAQGENDRVKYAKRTLSAAFAAARAASKSVNHERTHQFLRVLIGERDLIILRREGREQNEGQQGWERNLHGVSGGVESRVRSMRGF